VISGRTALYGLIGYPVGHSLSPAMQNAAFVASGLDAVYVALPVTPEALPTAIQGAHALGFLGLNLTVPHKRRAAALCVHLDPAAEEIGAVNTLRRVAEGYEGHNTDAPACLTLLEGVGVGRGSRALILGSGGAARAAFWALLKLGAHVRVAARRAEAAAEICHQMLSSVAGPHDRAEESRWDDIAAEADRSNVIVNATPVGRSGQRERLPPIRFRPGQIALDFVYGDSQFTRSAADAGATALAGEQLLVRQGTLSFNLWFGHPPPEEPMIAALSRPLGASQ
jgi:shikimate dehydrogenase